ncbi:MAG: STAS domain-containing protein [Pseudonocardiaceae bacterium]
MSSTSSVGPSANRGVYDVVAGRALSLEVETPLPWVRVLRVTGELDRHTAPRLISCVHTQLDGGAEHVVLDLSLIDLLRPAGLAALVEVQEAAATVGTELHLAGICRPEVTVPVQDRWQPEAFETHRTTIEALAAISEWPSTGELRRVPASRVPTSPVSASRQTPSGSR